MEKIVELRIIREEIIKWQFISTSGMIIYYSTLIYNFSGIFFILIKFFSLR